MDRYLLIAGRVLLSLIFLMSGFGKIAHWSGTESMMAGKGIPVPAVVLVVAVLCEILGGLSIFSGFYARLGALALFLYMIPVSLTMHDFWTKQGGERENQMIHFMKNVAIAGGLLVTAVRSQTQRDLSH